MSNRDSSGKSSEVEIGAKSTGNSVTSEGCDEFVGQASTQHGSTEGQATFSGVATADFGRGLQSEFETQEPATIADSPQLYADSGQPSVSIVLEICSGSKFRMYISILSREITTPLDKLQVTTDAPSAASPQWIVSPLQLVRGLADPFLSTRRPCSFRLCVTVCLDMKNAFNTTLWASIEVSNRVLVLCICSTTK